MSFLVADKFRNPGIASETSFIKMHNKVCGTRLNSLEISRKIHKVLWSVVQIARKGNSCLAAASKGNSQRPREARLETIGKVRPWQTACKFNFYPSRKRCSGSSPARKCDLRRSLLTSFRGFPLSDVTLARSDTGLLWDFPKAFSRFVSSAFTSRDRKCDRSLLQALPLT